MRVVPGFSFIFDIRLDMTVFFLRRPGSPDMGPEKGWMVQQRQGWFTKAFLGSRQGGRRRPCQQER